MRGGDAWMNWRGKQRRNFYNRGRFQNGTKKISLKTTKRLWVSDYHGRRHHHHHHWTSHHYRHAKREKQYRHTRLSNGCLSLSLALSSLHPHQTYLLLLPTTATIRLIRPVQPPSFPVNVCRPWFFLSPIILPMLCGCFFLGGGELIPR